MLAVLTGLVIGTATCLAQAPPVRLGDPIPAIDSPAPPPQSTGPVPSLGPLVPPTVTLPGQTAVPSVRPARVGNIIIEGNQWTKEWVIRRQLPLLPGQILSFPDLRLAEANLARLGILEVNSQTGVRPTVTVDPDEDSEFKNIRVHVQETQTTSLLFGVNVNSDAGLSGSVVFNERNFDIAGWPESWEDFRAGRAFRGAGQELRLEATPGTQQQRYLVAFREPFLFDSPYSLQVGDYYYQFAYHDQYTESRLGTTITITRRLDRYWSVAGTLRLEDVGVHHLPFDAPPEITRDQGDHALVGFRAGVTYDTRDSYIRPSEGVELKLAFEQFTGDDTFPKLLFTAKEYWTLAQRNDGSGRQVLSLRTDIGYAGSHTPVFERFYAGGFRSLRGFAFRGVGPSDQGIEVGGDFEFLNSLEYQVPILANDHLYAVAFLDSGTVESNVEIRNYRVAAGLGLRIQIPQLGPVPLALDFGVPIIKAHGDHAQLFGFSVGFYH